MESLEGWHDFGVAMAGASGALAGLLIVAMSVNIEVIVTSKSMPARAGASIATLILTVVAACLLLVPGAPGWAYGLEVLAGTAIAWVFAINAVVRVARSDERGSRSRFGSIAAGLLPLIAFSVGAVLLIAGVEAGMIGIVVGCVLAIAAAVLISWVTLVEVRR